MYSRIKARFSSNPAFFYAMSIAATWAGAGSFIVGSQIATNFGIFPWLLWALGNTLTCIVFGLLAQRMPRLRAVAKSRPVQILMGLMCIFQIWVNMNGIYGRVNAVLEERNSQIAGLSSEKASLSEKVAIAAQLDATNISLSLLNKRDKPTKKLKDTKKMQVNFTITKNVTASNGNRTVYVRIQNPGGNTLSGGGSFAYENRNLEYSMKKTIEYTGEEVSVATFWTVSQMLEGGQYRVSIFADGNMIGSRTFNFE